MSAYNATFSINCFKSSLDQLGVAYIPPFTSGVTKSVLQYTLPALNLSQPAISAGATDDSLSSKTNFPNFARVCIVSQHLAFRASEMLKILGWQKLAIISQNETFGNGWYRAFIESARKQNLEILNKEELRIIPPNLKYDDFSNYSAIFEEVINCNARLLILVINAPMSIYMLEKFYDMGMRSGDLYLMFASIDTMTSIYSPW